VLRLMCVTLLCVPPLKELEGKNLAVKYCITFQ
jgi:hypothetical protein